MGCALFVLTNAGWLSDDEPMDLDPSLWWLNNPHVDPAVFRDSGTLEFKSDNGLCTSIDPSYVWHDASCLRRKTVVCERVVPETCATCKPGHYCVGGTSTLVPEDTYTDRPGATEPIACECVA